MCILTVFGYCNPMIFIPKLCLIIILCSVGITRIDGGENVENFGDGCQVNESNAFN